jgi:hypothetical protein
MVLYRVADWWIFVLQFPHVFPVSLAMHDPAFESRC